MLHNFDRSLACIMKSTTGSDRYTSSIAFSPLSLLFPVCKHASDSPIISTSSVATKVEFRSKRHAFAPVADFCSHGINISFCYSSVPLLIRNFIFSTSGSCIQGSACRTAYCIALLWTLRFFPPSARSPAHVECAWSYTGGRKVISIHRISAAKLTILSNRRYGASGC